MIAEERANFHGGGCDGGNGDLLGGLRRYSYDYFAHPTEQSALAIPYKELDKIAAAAAARKNDQNENFAAAQEIGEDGERGAGQQTGFGKITVRSRSRTFSAQKRSKIIDLGWKM